MKRAEIMFCLFLLGFSVFMLVEGIQYDYSSDFGPGPGFAPVWLSSLTILFTIILLLKNIRLKETTRFFISKKGSRIALMLVSLLILAILIVPLSGLVLSLTIFSFIVLRYLEKNSLKVSFLVSIATMSFILVVFNLWLDINLPTGYFLF